MQKKLIENTLNSADCVAGGLPGRVTVCKFHRQVGSYSRIAETKISLKKYLQSKELISIFESIQDTRSGKIYKSNHLSLYRIQNTQII